MWLGVVARQGGRVGVWCFGEGWAGRLGKERREDGVECHVIRLKMMRDEVVDAEGG